MVLESNNLEEIKFIQFNDESSLNAIGSEDWSSLINEIEDFEKSDLKYLVIKHVNGNYSAGAQLGENINALMDDVSAAALKLWNCKKPVISLVDGIAAGAGSNMMLLSDFIIATPETRFIEVFVRRGLVVDFGGSWILPRIIGIQKAKELMMTSNEISGEELNQLDVLYKMTSAENIDSEFKNLIEKLNNQSFISVCMVKQQIKEGLDLTFEQSLQNETDNQNSRFLHSDAAEGMLAFIEKRKPNFKNTLDE
ncbi:enoyl-CoA hydratase/isomerase family protein [Acidimicrobiaceae bacterium]|nr:enoyl-CoA hydratase/isomerase family protein [Acidimicrobiaceae bacterium]